MRASHRDPAAERAGGSPTDRRTDKTYTEQTSRQADRQTCRQIDARADGQTDRAEQTETQGDGGLRRRRTAQWNTREKAADALAIESSNTPKG